MRAILVPGLVLLGLVAGAVAQAKVKSGDLLISDYGSASDIVVLDPRTGQTTLLLGFSWISPIDDVVMKHDNVDLRCFLGGSLSVRGPKNVTPQGQMGHVRDIPGVPGFFVAAADLDQDASYVLSSPAGTLHRVLGTTLTTLATFALQSWHKVVRDDDTGDYVVASPESSGHLVRVDRKSGQAQTIATGPGTLTGIDHDQRTGHFWVSALSAGARLVHRATGQVLSFPSGARTAAP